MIQYGIDISRISTQFVLQDPRQKEDRRRMDYSQRLQCEHTYTADRGQDYRMKLNRSVQIVYWGYADNLNYLV